MGVKPRLIEIANTIRGATVAVARGLVLFVSSVSLASCQLTSDYRFQTYDGVKNELSRIPGITVTDIGGTFDDGLLLMDIYAELDLQRGGYLYLSGLTKGSFRSGGTFSIGQVGSWTTAFNRLDVQRRPDTISVGSSGEAMAYLEVPVERVQDVIERYEEILAAIERWPISPEKVTGQDATSPYWYSRKQGHGASRNARLRPLPGRNAISRCAAFEYCAPQGQR